MDRAYGIQTLLMTDVVGSTRLWAAHPTAMPGAIERLEILAHEAVMAEGGELVKRRGEGDSLFCVFATPVAAARSALALVQALAAEPWPQGLEIRVRAAIHCGPAHERGGDLFGPVPNRCARLREVGHGGQILLSGAARAHVPPHEALGLVDLGRHRLRDLDEPESVWQVGAAAHPPLRSLTSLRNNLPIQYTSFVGREALRRDLIDRLGSDRITTLTGAGGSGKTRLALQLGAETIDLFPDGVWFVELADATDERGLLQAFSQATGNGDLDDAAGIAMLAERLRARSSALLIVDNAEHLLSFVNRTFATLLARVPGIRLLITSREPVKLRGERVYRVPPLSTPPAGCEDPFLIGDTEAGRLFLDRATQHLPEFELRPSNARAVGEIVRRLDGIPLGLEMAASHVGYLSPEQIAARLHDRFALLEGEDADAPARHRTMRETIAWQVDTLEENDRTLFQRLAVFAGFFSLEAAEAVTSDAPLDPETVMRRLRALVDKSLVVAVLGGAETRYRMLETIAQYATEAGESEIDATLPSLFDWALRTSGASYDGMNGPEHNRWVDLLDTMEASFRRALEWAFSAADPRAARLARNLTRYWHFRARFGEGYSVLARATRDCDDPALCSEIDNAIAFFASRLGEYEAAERAYRDVLARTGVPPLIRARVSTNLGILLNERGDLDGARTLYGAAMELAVEVSDDALQRLIGYNDALALMDGEQYDEATRQMQRVREKYELAEDKGRVALALESLASVALFRDRAEETATNLCAAFEAVGSQPDAQFAADALLDAAWVAARTGHFEDAFMLLSGHRLKQRSIRTPAVRRNARKLESVEAMLRGNGTQADFALIGGSDEIEPIMELARQVALRESARTEIVH